MILYFLFITFLAGFVENDTAKRQVIIDADTANEVDDLYAIVRAFAEPDWEVLALNATQWQASQWAIDNSMEESHRLNTVLHAYLNLGEKVKLCRGGFRRMYDWGDKAQHSAAAYEIIKQAHRQRNGKRLTIIALGALTNVASALYIDPTIAPLLEVYWLGSTYDFGKNQSKRLDFNAVMDVQAVEIMLTSQVEMHIMPVNVVANMKFDYRRTQKVFQGKHELTDFLLQRWFNHAGSGRQQRVLWDVALIEAMINPELVEEVKVSAFENENVWMYKSINEKDIIENLYTEILGLIKTL